MKRFAAVAVVFLAVAMAACNAKASQLNASWQYTFAPAGQQGAACTSQQTTNCIKQFTVEDVSNPGNPVIVATVAAPALSISSTIPTPAYGPHLYGVVANFVNNDGSAGTSVVSNNVSVTITAPAPTGFAITIM